MLRLFRFLGKYFDEISQDTGKFCFGVEDTMKVLLSKMSLISHAPLFTK